MFGRLFCFLLGAALGILITGSLAYDILSNNYTYAEMDWDQDGHTTISEMLHGGDVGNQDVKVSGRPCRRFFEYKDGRTIKVVCDGKIMTFNPGDPQYE